MKPLGPIAYILKARVTLLRDLGAALSPFNAFLILQGIETLALRIERHSENARGGRAVARQAAGSGQGHPSLAAERQGAASARRSISRAAMAAWSASSWRAGRRLVGASSTRCKLFYHVANIGDARSLAIHPASTTHSQLSPEEQAATGVTEGYVRLSIGIEHIDDILADLDHALGAAGAAKIAAE